MNATYLMSSPECQEDHEHDERCTFRIAWSINPYMHPDSGDPVDPSRASLQHQDLRNTLMRCGAQVVEVPFVRGAYDSVFIKDNALLIAGPSGRKALLARPRHMERQIEQFQRAKQLEHLGFEVMSPGPGHFEGGDVVVQPEGPYAFLGYGPRSDQKAARVLENALGMQVLSLELKDPYLYHLDTALAALNGGWILACREAFTDASWGLLQAHISAEKILRVPYREAMRFATNLVEVDDRVILGGFAPRTFELLRGVGKQVVFTPLSRFHMAGGSAACLTTRIHQRSRATTRPTAASLSTWQYLSCESSSPKMSGSISA